MSRRAWLSHTWTLAGGRGHRHHSIRRHSILCLGERYMKMVVKSVAVLLFWHPSHVTLLVRIANRILWKLKLTSSLIPRRWKVAYGEISSSCPGIEPPAAKVKSVTHSEVSAMVVDRLHKTAGLSQGTPTIRVWHPWATVPAGGENHVFSIMAQDRGEMDPNIPCLWGGGGTWA